MKVYTPNVNLTNVLAKPKRGTAAVFTPYGWIPLYVQMDGVVYHLVGHDWLTAPANKVWSRHLYEYLIEDLRYHNRSQNKTFGFFLDRVMGVWSIVSDRSYPPYREIVVKPISTRTWNILKNANLH
jgi:hypothetical protein